MSFDSDWNKFIGIAKHFESITLKGLCTDVRISSNTQSRVCMYVWSWQKNVVEHYHEEERDLLPQLNIADLGRKMQEEMVTQCCAVMEESHGRQLPFLLQGLQPHEVYQYLGLFQTAFEGGKSRMFTRMSFCLKNADEEFKEVCKLAQERIAELTAAAANDKAAGA